jgi:plasmid stabilization system protein ParE
MNAPFQFTPQAAEDLDAIWWFIAEDNRDAANSVEMEIIAACRRLAKHPLMGTRRQDITPLAVRFWTLPKFSNYVIVYRPNTPGGPCATT